MRVFGNKKPRAAHISRANFKSLRPECGNTQARESKHLLASPEISGYIGAEYAYTYSSIGIYRVAPKIRIPF